MQKPVFRKSDKWSEQPWHLRTFNDGFDICYVNDNGFSVPVPLSDDGDDGHTGNLALAQYIIRMHNNLLRAKLIKDFEGMERLAK